MENVHGACHLKISFIIPLIAYLHRAERHKILKIYMNRRYLLYVHIRTEHCVNFSAIKNKINNLMFEFFM